MGLFNRSIQKRNQVGRDLIYYQEVHNRDDRGGFEWPCTVGQIPPIAESFQHREHVDELIASLSGGLSDPAAAVLTQVLSGLGGAGKTQLAAEFSHRCWDEERDLSTKHEEKSTRRFWRNPLDLRLWITASSRDDVIVGYANAAREVIAREAPDRAGNDDERLSKWFLGWLESTDRCWLIVLDDVQDPADLKGLWPPRRRLHGRTIITTRRQDSVLTDGGRHKLDVGLFSHDEATTYLREKISSKHPNVAHALNEGKISSKAKSVDEVEKLAADLRYLPLALSQAAHYIVENQSTCADYRRKLLDRRNTLKRLFPPVGTLPDEYETTLSATWSLSVEQADKLHPIGMARPLLELSAMLDPNGIPAEFFTTEAVRNYIAESIGNESEVTVDEAWTAMHNLRRLSLATIYVGRSFGAQEQSVRVHALVQRATRDLSTRRSRAKIARTVANSLVEMWPDASLSASRLQVIVTSIEILRSHDEFNLFSPSVHRVLFLAGNGPAGIRPEKNQSLDRDWRPQGAVRYFAKLYDDTVRLLGNDHHDALLVRNNLSFWRGRAGDYQGAVSGLQELLRDQIRSLGKNHRETLRSRQDLAHWQGKSGDHVGASAALSSLLDDQIRILGPKHQDTLITVFDFAHWKGMSGDLAGAVADLECLIPHYFEMFGPEDERTLAAQRGLARWYREQGDVAGAIGALSELLSGQCRALGRDHPESIISSNQLHGLLRAVRADVGSIVLSQEKLLSARLGVLGSDHPCTLNARNNLAFWRGHIGDAKGAVVALDSLLSDQVRLFGPDHPQSLDTRGNLAYWLGKSGDEVGASTALEKLVADRVRVQGVDHPETLLARHELFYWRGQVGHALGGAKALEGALADRLRVLGADHPDTLSTRHELIYWRGEAGDAAGAAAAFEELVADRLRVLGADHPDTLSTRHELIYWRGEAGDAAGAAGALQELLAEQVRMLGSKHQDTFSTRSRLAFWRSESGDPSAAVAELEDLLNDQIQVLGAYRPETLSTRYELAQAKGAAGDAQGAVAELDDLLQDQIQVFGDHRPETLATRHELARWQHQIDWGR